MKKRFEFEFLDESSSNQITFEYDDESDIEEEMEVSIVGGIPTMYANQKALMALGKAFIKMSLCDYKDGFHIHFRRNFDGDQPETFLVVLNRF